MIGIEHSHSGMGNSYHDGNYNLHTGNPKTTIGIEHYHSGMGNSCHDGNYNLHTGNL